LEDFHAEGHLPEAMLNYLMLLGWARLATGSS
jgi:glutamyl/glutaminyl-tRNA synthetase